MQHRIGLNARLNGPDCKHSCIRRLTTPSHSPLVGVASCMRRGNLRPRMQSYFMKTRPRGLLLISSSSLQITEVVEVFVPIFSCEAEGPEATGPLVRPYSCLEDLGCGLGSSTPLCKRTTSPAFGFFETFVFVCRAMGWVCIGHLIHLFLHLHLHSELSELFPHLSFLHLMLETPLCTLSFILCVFACILQAGSWGEDPEIRGRLGSSSCFQTFPCTTVFIQVWAAPCILSFCGTTLSSPAFHASRCFFLYKPLIARSIFMILVASSSLRQGTPLMAACLFSIGAFFSRCLLLYVVCNCHSCASSIASCLVCVMAFLNSTVCFWSKCWLRSGSLLLSASSPRAPTWMTYRACNSIHVQPRTSSVLSFLHEMCSRNLRTFLVTRCSFSSSHQCSAIPLTCSLSSASSSSADCRLAVTVTFFASFLSKGSSCFASSSLRLLSFLLKSYNVSLNSSHKAAVQLVPPAVEV